MKLDLACGQRCKEGFEGVDLVGGHGVTHVVDLMRPRWPFDPDSVNEIWCSHFVEHLPNLIVFMDNVHRILKPGGIVRIVAPYYTSMRAFQDPTHVRFITDASFCYFDAEWRKREGLSHYPIASDFEQLEVKHWINPAWEHMKGDDLKLSIRSCWNVIEDIEFTLRRRG